MKTVAESEEMAQARSSLQREFERVCGDSAAYLMSRLERFIDAILAEHGIHPPV